MCIGTESATVHDDEEDGSDDGNEIEREIHEVSDDCRGGEFGEGLLCEFS